MIEIDNFFSAPNKPVSPATAIIIPAGNAELFTIGMNILSLNDLLKRIPAIPMPSKRMPAISLLNKIPGDPFPVSIAFRSQLFSFCVTRITKKNSE